MSRAVTFLRQSADRLSANLGFENRLLPSIERPHTQSCRLPRCQAEASWWQVRRRARGISINGNWYCSLACAEEAMVEEIRTLALPAAATRPPARLPLGLMLVSSALIDAGQLRAGLDAQRSAGRGRLGEWLLDLHLINEDQLTAMLARQAGCSVLTDGPVAIGALLNLIPIALLQSYQMFPAQLENSSGRLQIGFGGQIDYGMVKVLEMMLGRPVRPGMVSPSACRAALRDFERLRQSHEIAFDNICDDTEIAHIVLSYAVRLGAVAIRQTRLNQYFWARLLPATAAPVNLLFAAGDPILRSSA